MLGALLGNHQKRSYLTCVRVLTVVVSNGLNAAKQTACVRCNFVQCPLGPCWLKIVVFVINIIHTTHVIRT